MGSSDSATGEAWECWSVEATKLRARELPGRNSDSADRRAAYIHAGQRGENAMSKGADIKKEAKKKPAKTLKEKKAERKAKKGAQGSLT